MEPEKTQCISEELTAKDEQIAFLRMQLAECQFSQIKNNVSRRDAIVSNDEEINFLRKQLSIYQWFQMNDISVRREAALDRYRQEFNAKYPNGRLKVPVDSDYGEDVID